MSSAYEECSGLLQPAGKTRDTESKRLDLVVKPCWEKGRLWWAGACGLCCPLLVISDTNRSWPGPVPQAGGASGQGTGGDCLRPDHGQFHPSSDRRSSAACKA